MIQNVVLFMDFSIHMPIMEVVEKRVLWQAVKATLLADDKNICVIYTTNIEAQPLDILNKANKNFKLMD